MSVGGEFGDLASAYGEEIYYRTKSTTIKNPKTMLTKVKGVQASGSFENKYGSVQDNPELPNHGKTLLYKFEYVMEDGTVITANHKTNASPFPQGTEVEYEVVKDDPQYGKSGKVSKPGASNFQQNTQATPKGGVGEDLRQLMIVRQSSLNRAVEICIHNSIQLGDSGKYHYPLSVVEKDILELAGRLTKWVMRTEKKEEKKVEEVVANSSIGTQNDLPVVEEEGDDLPF